MSQNKSISKKTSDKLEFTKFLLSDKKNSIIFKKKIGEFEEKKVKVESYLDELYERKAKSLKTGEIIWANALIKYWEEVRDKTEKEIKRFTFYYNKCMGRVQKTVGQINDDDIAKAKEVPIEYFMPYKEDRKSQNRKYYKCPLPLHQEKTASFVYYTDQNTYSCFGCSQAGDNIDLYMKLNNCDFITAIKELIKLT